MKEEEIEYEERTVERTYCDDCGDECTDDYGIEAKHVCPSCRGDSWYESISGLPEGNVNLEGTTSFWLFAIVVWPLFLLISIADGIEEANPDTAWSYVTGSLGALLWLGAAFFFGVILSP